MSTTTGTEAPARTHVPVLDDDAAPALPRPGLGRPTAEERFIVLGSWVGAFALAWLVTQRLLPLGGPAWLLVAWLVLGLVMTAVTSSVGGTRVDVIDRVVTGVVTTGAMVVGAALVSAVVFVVYRGWQPLLHLNFFVDDMSGVGPRNAFDQGGIVHAVAGSMIQLGIAVAVTLPLGIGTAVFMTEVGGRFAQLVRTIVEAMTALPSIVAGLFIYTTLIVAVGFPRSGFAAAMALSVMMLPIIARAADVVLRVVPGGLREASLALGASRWRTVWHVVLPTARPGLATAVILGVARGVGETSPVLLTSGAASFVVINPTDGVMSSLPLFIFTGARSPEPMMIERAFAAATVLLVLVLALFVIARLVARQRTGPRRTLRRKPAPSRETR
ncbi:phosphate ABC transporter permease PstA [Nocardioides sp. LHG3406-4]|uniref:phosphate ABC transporter permease PstA n=1 Tax=Nocardioides sp. LHG3406-4 TaxID=2804575 RepID=UPI003CF8EA13